MNEEKKGFGYCFDKSLKDLKNNLFLVVPDLIIFAVVLILGALTAIPLIKKATENPFLFENYIDENIGMFMGVYALFMIVALIVSLFVASGNMYMTKRVVLGESEGLKDFTSGMTKYALRLLGFYVLLIIISIGLVLVLGLTMLIPILGILLIIAAYIYFVTVMQSYDAAMAMGDNGVFDTFSKMFDFGNKNFLTLFLLVLLQVVVSVMFQATASAPFAAIGDPYGSGFTTSLIIVTILVVAVQVIVSVFLGVFTRLFRFHLYYANELGGGNVEEEAAIEDYVVTSREEE